MIWWVSFQYDLFDSVKMLKNWCSNNSLFKQFKSSLKSLWSLKDDVLLCQFNHESNYLEKIFDKSVIEVAKFYKDLNLFQIYWSDSIYHYLYLFWIHIKVINR